METNQSSYPTTRMGGQEADFYWMAVKVEGGWCLYRHDHFLGEFAPTIEEALDKMRRRTIVKKTLPTMMEFDTPVYHDSPTTARKEK